VNLVWVLSFDVHLGPLHRSLCGFFWLFSDVESYLKLYLSSLEQDKVLNLKTSKSLVKRRKMEAEELYRFLRFKLRTCEMDQDNFIWTGRDDFRYWVVRDMVTVSLFELPVWPRVLQHWCDSLCSGTCSEKSSQEWYRFFWETFRSVLRVILTIINDTLSAIYNFAINSNFAI
jgi:hypothetical protein